MSETIKVGDLVQIVRWSCCGAYLGAIFRVVEVDSYGMPPRCRQCGADIQHKTFAFEGSGIAFWAAPLSWLKRIPPLDELEGEKRREELHA